jgi:hypothetical protein
MAYINCLHAHLENMVRNEGHTYYDKKSRNYLLFGTWKTETYIEVSEEGDGDFVVFVDDTQTNKSVAVENPTVEEFKAIYADPFGYLEANGTELSDMLKYGPVYFEELDNDPKWEDGE